MSFSSYLLLRRASVVGLLVLSAACYSQWEQEQKNPPDPKPRAGCPKVSLRGTLLLDPCCTDDNECGGDTSALGYGCSALSNPTFRSLLSSPPPAQTCDGELLDDDGATAGRADKDAGKDGGTQASEIVHDESCPSVEIMGELPEPCCVEGACGLDLSRLGFGCRSLSDATLGRLVPDLPAPQACGSDADRDPEQDEPASMQPDAGGRGRDAGTSARDAGATGRDAGASTRDAGPTRDGGSGRADAAVRR